MPTSLRMIGSSYHLIVPMEYVKESTNSYNFGEQGNIVYTVWYKPKYKFPRNWLSNHE